MSKSNLRMSWAGDYSSLQEFVEDKLCLVGKWSSIGGEKKQFEGGNIVINWWKNKKYLAISGEKASDIVNQQHCLPTLIYSTIIALPQLMLRIRLTITVLVCVWNLLLKRNA